MKLTTDGFEFDFPTAIDLYKFDEPDKAMPHYHGASHCMKAVDVVVELPDRYLFLELKKPLHGAADYTPKQKCKTCGHREEPLRELQNDLITKCRDTWLYRYCEDKTDKPCHFICIITVDDAMVSTLLGNIRKRMPPKRPIAWRRHFIEEMSAVNPAAWARNYSHYGSVKSIP